MLSLLLLLGGLSAVAQPGMTGSRYVEQVLASGPRARVAESEAALGRAEAVGAGLWPNPSVRWERESLRTGSGVGATQDILAASVPLVLSGRLGLEAEAAGLGARAAEARREQALLRLRYAARRAFSAALGAQERRGVLEESLESLRRLEEAVAAREKAGEAAGYEHLRISLEASLGRDLLRGAVLEERARKAEALGLLPPDFEELPPLEGPLAPEEPLPSRETLLAALEERPDVRALELEARSAELARRAAGRRWIPEPTASAGALRLSDQPGSGTGYVAGLSVPLPLFQRGQGEEARARARQELAEARREALMRAARTRLAVAYDEVVGRRERLARHVDTVLERTAELRRIAEAAWRGGSAELLVLMDAERTFREARLAAIQLAIAVVEAEAELLLLVGASGGAEPRSAE